MSITSSCANLLLPSILRFLRLGQSRQFADTTDSPQSSACRVRRSSLVLLRIGDPVSPLAVAETAVHSPSAFPGSRLLSVFSKAPLTPSRVRQLSPRPRQTQRGFKQLGDRELMYLPCLFCCAWKTSLQMMSTSVPSAQKSHDDLLVVILVGFQVAA